VEATLLLADCVNPSSTYYQQTIPVAVPVKLPVIMAVAISVAVPLGCDTTIPDEVVVPLIGIPYFEKYSFEKQ
jgi:hypothetical protein